MSCEVKLKQLLQNYTAYPELITNAASLKGDLDMDSLEFIEAIMCIEEHYSIELHDEGLPKLVTVADVVDMVNLALLNGLRGTVC